MNRDLSDMKFNPSQMKRYLWHIKRALSQMKFNLSEMKRYP